MKVMFIVYHDIRTEARSQEILEVAKKLSDDVILVSYSIPFDTDNLKMVLTGNGRRKYFSFIRTAIKSIKQENPDVVILHDNYTSVILRWMKRCKKSIYIIYDSSELYIDVKPKSFKARIAKFMNYFEKKYLKYANIVIAANIERAQIMKDYFNLKEIPIVFDNIHRIDYKYNYDYLNEKYCEYFEGDKFNVLYAGGIAKSRMTFELVEAIGKLGSDYQLIICGTANPIDKKEFDTFIKDNGFNNIYYIGLIPRNELKYMLKRAHISVSAFAQDTVNNINCASGKLYESLFEGTPILTSENPPLKRICNDYHVGVSSENFTEGILELKNNYESYCKNVNLYIETLNYDNRVDLLVHKIKNRLPNKWK